MKTAHIKIIFTAVLAAVNLAVSGQSKKDSYNEIYGWIEQKNFFKAKEIYELQKNKITADYQNFIEAILNNAFNKLSVSNEKIAKLLGSKSNISARMALELYRIKADNAIKLYEYKEAKNAYTAMLNDYGNLLTEDQKSDIGNSLKIWSALENVPKQNISIKSSNRLKMEKDKAGLNNLKVYTETDSLHFIFDTGANLSTTSKSVAEQFNMKIIPVDIEVGAITGMKVMANLAVCKKMRLGNSIEIENAVFLVFDDKDLAFPQIDYRIYGILGFPIIEALREIQITQDGYFIVPEQETQTAYSSNMAMDELKPLIYINGRHFTFDTGAADTMLYSRYYLENQKEIDVNFQPVTISFGGVGGKQNFKGYKINETFTVFDKTAKLNNITLLKEKIKDEENVYGNIGQDLIKQFSRMTLNFNQMFIKFD